MLAPMTGGVVACPDENVLVRFSTGQLSGADLGSIEQHLDGCGACRTLIAQLTSGQVNLAPSTEVRHGRIGRYVVERLVGGGGMGMVYAARDKELNRVVAIKLLRTSALASAESRSRLLREAQTMAKLSHPNLVPIFELGSDQGDDFLAMELVDGPTLDLWLRERKRDWRDVLRVFIEAGSGLEAAHEAGVVHRDFKPGNVLVGRDGRARVTDFGLARPMVPGVELGGDAAPIGLTREGALLGTPAYMAPEQLTGQVADVRSDQFSYCVALVEALAGHRPFPGRTVEELRTAMKLGKPPELELENGRLRRALLKGLSISPEARFESMSALLAELAAILKPDRTSRGAALGLALAVVLAAGAGVAWQQREAPAAANTVKRGALKFVVGEQQVLTIPGVQRVAIGDSEITDVKTIGNDRLLLIGGRAGRTTLIVWTSAEEKSQRLEWDVLVEATGETIAAPAGPKAFKLSVGAQKVLSIKDIERVAIGDSSIADVKTIGNDELLVIGAGAGSTTLIVWADSARLEWVVTVEGENPAPK